MTTLKGRATRWIAAAIAVVVLFVGAGVGRGSAPDLPTSEVTKGDFVDAVELRGEIRPIRSIVMAAPMQAGELQIVKLARNGSTVKAGDIVVQFDTSTVDRTIQEKRTEVKQAEAEIDQSRAQMKITEEQTATALMKARYDVDRAKIDLSAQSEELNTKIDREKAKLALADAEQRLKEGAEKARSDRAAAQADLNGKLRKREKALADLQRAERSRQNLEMRAPADGMVSIMPNFRAGGMFGSNAQEFREGDRAWSGAQVVELPDLSEIRFEARLDETDRGRIAAGQAATIRVDAVPDRQFTASVSDVSVLARVDFTSGTWPPARNFDLKLKLGEKDPRLRPGMSSTARIAVDRLPGSVIVPARAVFQKDGRPVVYLLDGRAFEARPVEIARRGKEQIAIRSGVSPGDRVATKMPERDMLKDVQ
ncbi:MAG: efflux RND transporter periplasmic adaptor subunit [Vicinamibacterales bacterium]